MFDLSKTKDKLIQFEINIREKENEFQKLKLEQRDISELISCRE